MKIIDTTEAMRQIQRGGVLTIGNFDGVHLGHQAILQTAREQADRRKTNVIVMTFDPHPLTLLRPQHAPAILTPMTQKQHLLRSLNVDVMVIVKDCLKLLNLSPADFVDQFLMAHLEPSVVVEGPNFNFGYGRSGNNSTLRQLGADRGFEVIEVPFREVRPGGEDDQRICSSSLIRELLSEGKVQTAAYLLGRPYQLLGQTVAGRGVGKTLGFPTANIGDSEQVIPAEGVYAGFVIVGDSLEQVFDNQHRRPAAISIGRAKTFITDYPLLLEAHILEEQVEDLYGKTIAMEFIRHVRGQRRFESKEALSAQIAEDCRQIWGILKESNNSV